VREFEGVERGESLKKSQGKCSEERLNLKMNKGALVKRKVSWKVFHIGEGFWVEESVAVKGLGVGGFDIGEKNPVPRNRKA